MLENVFGFAARLARGPLAPIVRLYAWSLPIIAFLGLFTGLLEGVGIGLIIPLATLFLFHSDTGLPGPIARLVALTSGMDDETRMVALGATLIGFIAIKCVVQSLNALFITNIDGRLARDIRNALCARVLALDYPALLAQDRARLVAIISTDCWQAAEAIRQATQMIPAIISLAVLGGLLAWIDWVLALAAIFGAGMIQAALFFVERRQRRNGRLLARDNHELGERMLEVVLAMRVVRIFGRQQREQDQFAAASERTRRSNEVIRRLSSTLAPIVDGLISTLLVGILLIGSLLGTSGTTLIAFLVLLLRAQPHAHAISRARSEIAGLEGSVSEVEWLLAQQPARQSLAGTLPVTAIDKPIRFDGVTYHYGGDLPAVSDLNLVIHPGRATALIGKSGAGKTTLINLLCRLCEPSSGAIYHGEVRLDALQPEQWRARLAIAGQDIELLSTTVADNIAYGAPWATHGDIVDAARAAGADAFIAKLPDGYDTPLNFQSLNFSSGQRQRIGLARALLRRPDLLILDEATSAVDSMSEAEIVQLLDGRRHFKTVLVVSHRKSTLQACEDCIVLDHGRVVEAGPLSDAAYYRKMA